MYRIILPLAIFVPLNLGVPRTMAAEDQERPGDLQPLAPLTQVRMVNFQNYGHQGNFAVSPDGRTLAELHASWQKVLAAAPYSSHCPLCYLAHPSFSHPDCKLCRGQGWTTQIGFESCPENYRHEMFRARRPSTRIGRLIRGPTQIVA
jgi:hypothetical protein